MTADLADRSAELRADIAVVVREVNDVHAAVRSGAFVASSVEVVLALTFKVLSTAERVLAEWERQERDSSNG